MKALYLLAILIATISHLSASAQDYRPGFVIKSNGDSIPGFVEYKSTEAVYYACFFKPNLQSAETRYSTKEIIAYGFINDKRYEAEMLADEVTTAFLECLVAGPISLYRYNSVFYAKKYDGPFTELPIPQKTLIANELGQRILMKVDNKYRGLLNSMLYDCKINANRVKYAEVAFAALVHKYNRCKGATSISYKNNKSMAHVNMQILVGEDFSHIKIDGENPGIYKFSYAPTAGIGFDFSSPRLNDKTFFGIEISYVKKVYQGYDEQVTNLGTIKRDDYVTHASFLKIPFGVRYNFRKEIATPYFRLGLVEYINLTHSAYFLREAESGTTVSTFYNKYDLKFKNMFGICLSLGYQRTVSDKFKGFIELRGERNRGDIGYMGYAVTPKATMLNFAVLAGLRF
jgi:hypothetical protein